MLLNSDVTEGLLRSESRETVGGSVDESTLFVHNLSYIPSRTIGDVISQKILDNFPAWEFPLWERLTQDYMRPLLEPADKSSKSVALLRSVTFTARGGKLTAILSNDYGERRTIIDLISGRRKRGVYSGDISLCGNRLQSGSALSMNSAFVPRKVLFIPGLSYAQQVRYAARLRMCMTPTREYCPVDETAIEQRVADVLKLMDLWKVRHEILPEVLPDRGPVAGNLRRLSIAIEIVNFPPLIIVDDPLASLEPAVGLTIMQALKKLASRGHVVIVATPPPTPQELALIDHLVVIGSGYSIYSAPPQEVRSYFCNPRVGYELKKGVELMSFVLDIASGVERPKDHRGAVDAAMMQENFESSAFYSDDVGRPSPSNLAQMHGHGYVHAHAQSSNPLILDEKQQQVDKRSRNGNDSSAYSTALTAFHPVLFKFWGYGEVNSFRVYLHQLYIVTLRAVHAKILERDSLRRAFGSSVLVGLLVGYLMYGLGNYGKYTMTLLKFPYVNTSNITAMMFFLGAFVFTQQVLTCQLICRKVSLFRQEQASGYCGIVSFSIASLVSEAPVACLASWTFGWIVYFMSSLNLGVDNFEFFSMNIASIAIIGLQTAFMFAVLLRREILVRDIYLLIVFTQVLLSGFPFQLTAITWYFKNISEVIPLRWSFEALMAWKFKQNYYDGNAYITPYAFQNFEWYHALGYYHTFMLVTFAVTLLLLLSKPNLMRNYHFDRLYKKGKGDETNSNRIMYWCKHPLWLLSCCGLCCNGDDEDKERASSLDVAERNAWMTDEAARMNSAERRGDKDGSRSGSLSEAVGLGGSGGMPPRLGSSTGMTGRQGSNTGSSKGLPGFENPAFGRIHTQELARPLLYHRESSVTGSRLSNQVSHDGTRENFDHGPTVAFQHITYKTRDRSALSGYSLALENVSGQFDWGKLSCIMGASESGKSTLLHVLAGDSGYRSTVTGQVTYDGVMPDINLPLWKRCGLVRADDEHFPSLTVLETVTYAMELRVPSKEALAAVQENVMQTLGLLQLEEVANKQICKLTAGERRRVSIAEEIVHGPSLLLIDEPTTNLDPLAESILLRTFREMVNESRTVVATVHQPSAVVFELFDTLLLLSKGQVIYHGPANLAVNYFVQKPYNFPFKDYSNPGDFLTDISGGFLDESTGSGNKMPSNGFTLAKLWRKSDQYVASMRRMSPEKAYGATGKDKFAKKNNNNNLQIVTAASASASATRKSDSIKAVAILNSLDRTDTNETESTDDGGDQYAVSEKAQSGDSNDSGRLTFSRNANSYGGGKSATAVTQAMSMGDSSARGSLSAAAVSDVDDVYTSEQERKRHYDNVHNNTGVVRDFTDTVCGMFCLCLQKSVDGIYTCFSSKQARSVWLLHASILLRRSAMALWRRRSLFWGNIATTIGIAVILGWVMGPSGASIYNTTSFFAVGTLLLMLSNVQLISYLFATHQVFYKDHSRGMYSNLTYWLVASLPLYLLRSVGALCYGLIIYDMLELVTPQSSTFTDTRGYFLLVTIFTSVASTMMVELVIYVSDSIRTAYLVVPALSFLQFQFSGLFLKPVLLPTWMQPWAPSASLIRWTLQGSFLNQFQGNTTKFPVLPIYNTFNGFLSLFGWGGKTKWYCFNMVLAFIGVFRVCTLLGTTIVSQLRKGGRGARVRHEDHEEKNR